MSVTPRVLLRRPSPPRCPSYPDDEHSITAYHWDALLALVGSPAVDVLSAADANAIGTAVMERLGRGSSNSHVYGAAQFLTESSKRPVEILDFSTRKPLKEPVNA